MTDDYDPPKQKVSYSMSGGMTTGGMSASASFGGSAPVSSATAAPAQRGPVVKDITTQSFMADVMEASKSAPVIVDFWAPWCGPCKQLGPVIEKAVTDAAAKGHAITLCKMDVEKYPEVSKQMGVQSIPAVVAFIGGQPADAFMGAKPAAEVQAFVDKVAASGPPPAGAAMAQAIDEAQRLASAGQPAEAAELYAAILAQEPGNLDALAGLGQCYVAVGEIDMAQNLINQVPEDQRDGEAIAALVKTISLAEQASDLGELSELEAAASADPKDHQARFDYAVALNASGEREKAADQLLEIVRADRKWKEDGARAQLLEFFESWGNTDPATLAGRRSLSSILFS